MDIQVILRERAEAMTTMLSEQQWHPSRSHVETLRNYMAEGAAEIARLQAAETRAMEQVAQCSAVVERQDEEIARLRAALKPFALAADQVDGSGLSAHDYADTDTWDVTVGDLRRARAAYEGAI